MLNARLLAIVILATTAVACTIDPFPARTNHDAAADAGGAAGGDSGASHDAGDTASSHPDSSAPMSPDLGADTPVNGGTAPDTGTGAGGTGGIDAFSPTGGVGGADAPLGTGGVIGTDGGAAAGTGGTTSKSGSYSPGGSESHGGNPPQGGATTVGGTTASGGTTIAGGTMKTGGATTSGGATSAGGTTTTGGTTPSGGTTSSGGATGSGGTTGTGGSTGSGGACGQAGGAGGAGGAQSVNWSDVDMGFASVNGVNRIAVGNGRGDGTVRVYSGDTGTGLYEFSYSGSTWVKTTVSSTAEANGLKIGNVRNNGVEGIYTTWENLAEYLYQGSAWSSNVPKITGPAGIGFTNGLAIGAGRNDGYQRIYVADWQKFIEVSYNYGDWNDALIDSGGNGIGDVVVAQGRNDGTNRVYASYAYGPIWEYTWNNSTNSYALSACSSPSTSEDFDILGAGVGRNDGVQRIYAWGEYSGLYEFSYGAGGWTSVQISSVGFNGGGSLVLADGRNDGVIRLYTADQDGVGEYTFSNSWSKTSLVTSNDINGLAIGMGRNDCANRLYVTEGDDVHEYTATRTSSGGATGSGDTTGTGGSTGSGGACGQAGSTGGAGGAQSVNWSDVDMGFASVNSVNRIAIGNGRGDGTVRVYAGDLDTGLYEFSYSGSTWAMTTVSPTAEANGLKIGNVHNNGVEGIYTTWENLAEYLYQGSAWSSNIPKLTGPAGIGFANGLAIGAGRNDGYQRIYVADWQKFIEVSYNYGDWNDALIDSGGNGIGDVVVAQGRNDGTNRVYASYAYGPIWEYTWNNSTNSYALSACSSQSTAESFDILGAGAGRSDGVQRIYAWGEYSGLYEFSYGAGGWTSVQISSVGFNGGGSLVLADGRNDGTIRLYTADQDGVGEYTFSNSWSRTGLVTSNAANGLAIGMGRNDCVNRLYVTEGDDVHEYTATRP